ncbi:MAG: 2-oxo acid dehydrogenase subunit E2 [Actinomycetota bacterium]|nr:2-oxo acid dehydrogenase subunit E2 [Actinomycetota bacterium]
MSLQVFLLPDLGEGLTEAELVNWLVKVGDEIRVDQPIAEVETAKSVVEVPSPFSGVVAVLHGEAGQTLDVGKPLISVEAGSAAGRLDGGNDIASAADGPEILKPPSPGVPSPAGPAPAAGPAETTEEGSGNVLIGYGTSGHGGGGRTRPRKHAGVSARPQPASADHRDATADQASPASARRPAPQVISPLVRKLARDNGVSLSVIDGSGAHGLILRRDVEALLAGPAKEPTVPAAAAPSPAAEPDAAVVDPKTGLGLLGRTTLKGLRKTVAANLSRSRSEIPEATVWVDVDATALVEMRQRLKRADPTATPGLLAFIARFVTAGLAKFPELNTRVEATAEGTDIVAFDGVNLGFAAQTDRGLMVPAIRHAENLSARQLDTEIRRLTAVARDGKATPAELTSGTFTLNNYGVFGVDGSAAIINYPEVAILGVGRIIDKPWVVDGQLAVRKVTELTLVFDHRVCDGGTAGGFLRYIADAIENPGSVLADL